MRAQWLFVIAGLLGIAAGVPVAAAKRGAAELSMRLAPGGVECVG